MSCTFLIDTVYPCRSMPTTIESLLTDLAGGKSPSARALSGATLNRYRDRLSGMFKRAIRQKLVKTNPVHGIEKHKESSGRIVYLTATAEDSIRQAMPADLRALFTFSVHTGLRWSEQVGLKWRDIDLHAGVVTIPRSKNGEQRHVPLNSVARSVLYDLSLHRADPSNSAEAVFVCRHAQADKFFPKAVAAAREAVKLAGGDAARFEGYTWHGNRHTFASRLVMAGVDLRTVQELGGWRSLKMVMRYAHLAPAHLHAAVERIVARPAELGRNLDSAHLPHPGAIVTT